MTLSKKKKNYVHELSIFDNNNKKFEEQSECVEEWTIRVDHQISSFLGLSLF